MSADSSPGAEQSATAEPPMAQLPVELLLQCLLVADLVTRIRASHVCHTWLEAALSERRLWDSFECSRFRDKQHEDAMFGLLEAMLLRSRPLPFHLTVPHLDGRPGYDYTDRMLGLGELDVSRLAAYHGPIRLFRLLNPTCAPLPNLLCLDVMRFPDDGDPDITTIDLVAQFGARVLPNLRQLAAPNVRFPADSAPFGALRSITLDGIYGHHHRALRMEGVLPLFLASHEHPMELRMLGDDDQTVVLSTIPDNTSVWTLSPSSDWADDFLKDIDNPASERLTSISISFSRLGALLAAQLHVPGLEKLELRVDSAADADPPALHAGDQIFLRAPRLRRVSFALCGECAEPLEDFLTALRASFRTLLIYDADLLDTITVSHRAARACAGFASFAKEYSVLAA